MSKLLALCGATLMGLACGDDDASDDAGLSDASIGDGSFADSRPADADLETDAGPAADADVGDGGVGVCARCHGSIASAAPPVAISGASDTALRQIGAHQAHLGPSSWHAQLVCQDCHRVPATVDAEKHIDDALPAEVVFSERARAEGVEAEWDGVTCTTYCHGVTLSGGTATAPVWTKVDGSQSACGSCHALPPSEDHPDRQDCGSCHGAMMDDDGNIVNPSLHIDGKIEAVSGHPSGYAAPAQHGADYLAHPEGCGGVCHGADLGGKAGPSCDSCHSGWKTDCTFCHGGTDNDTGAPPAALDGSTSSGSKAVGAHSAHVEARSTHLAWGCEVCHPNYASAQDSGHLSDETDDLAFSAPAAATIYDSTNGSCSNNYCHGDGKDGATGSASWTGTLSGCESCHPTASLSNKHALHLEEQATCDNCHGTTTSNTAIRSTARSKHVNGKVDLADTFFQWDSDTGRCSSINGCHAGHPFNPRW